MPKSFKILINIQCILAFCHLDRILEKKQLKKNKLEEEGFIVVCSLRSFTLWSAASIILILTWIRISWQRGAMNENCSPHGNQAKGGGDWGQHICFQGTPLVTYFLQLGPTTYRFYYFPIIQPNLNPSMD